MTAAAAWHDRVSHYERLTLTTAPASEEESHHGWCLRASGTSTVRSNSATRVDSGIPLTSDMVAGFEAWFAARGQRAIFRVSEANLPADDELLSRRGYVRSAPTLLMTRPLDTTLPTSGEIGFTTCSIPDGMHQVAAWKGLTLEETAREAARQTRFQGAERFLLLQEQGTTAAAGLVRLVGEDAGIFSMHTAPAARRRGHAMALLVAQLDWARREGARTAFLQVDRDNPPAVALYARMGFLTLYQYWSRSMPAEAVD